MSITFRIIDIDQEQIENDQMIIHIGGRTIDNKSVYCKVLGYQPYCFLELPVDINWTESKISAVADYIRLKLVECPPDIIKFEIKKLCLYSVTRPILRINFKTEDSWRHLRNLLKYKWRIEGFNKEFGQNAFKLHEHNVPTLVKFGIERKLDMAGWITVKSYKPKGMPEDYSWCDYSIYTKASWVGKASDISPDVLPDPEICAFDFELHSKNRKSSSPAVDIPENVLTMASLTFGRLSQPLEQWDTYCITQYVGDKAPDKKYKATVIDCKGSEKKLIVEFAKLVRKKQPDIMTGYNINGFDWGCILKRAEICEVSSCLLKMGKLKYEKDRVADLSWESTARGKQEIRYIKLKGVFNFDLFPDIKFNHNLPTYKLSFVADHFLKGDEAKEDMPYQQMFALFDMVEVLERSLENSIDMNASLAKKLIISKTVPEELLQVPGMVNHVAEFVAALKDKSCKTLDHVVQIARSFMLRMIKYVIQDARICPALIKFNNSLTSLWETSIICKCPPSYVYEKGQQIKVLAQYVEKAYERNFVVPFYNKAKDEKDEEDEDGKNNYQGATVIKVKKGLYRNIATLDFASLYPSIMRAYNICHTKLIPPDVKIDDSECNIAKWSEHIRCEHDPEKRKKKKNEKAFCGDHYYRFRKHHGKDENKGLMPLLLDTLGVARSKVKKELAVKQNKWKDYKKIELVRPLTDEEKREMDLVYRVSTVFDARQLAIKLSMNSSYGFYGAKTGYFPCLEGAASVTYYGREAIHKTIQLVEAKWPTAEVIYGDSVSADTPVLVFNGEYASSSLISELCHQWKSYNAFKLFEKGLQKEQNFEQCPLKVWSDKGWVDIVRIIRHKCEKQMYRVCSRFGCVDVTEDHSLIDENGWQIKPQKLVVGKTKLMYNDLQDKYVFDDNSVFATKSKKEAMDYMANSIIRQAINVDENGQYTIFPTFESENLVTSVIPLGICTDFVYDLETSCGRFHAGPGWNIVKNTDSVFVNFHVPTIKQAFELQREAEKYVTSHFPPEMKIAADNFYSPLLLLTKKRYEYSIIDEDGQVLKDGSKGSINKRRDNCDAARDIYTLALELTKNGLSQDETLYAINQKILDIYRGLCPLQNFVIYKGLKQVVEDYKKCVGHVLFAKRLEERGNVMKSGTRLEYVFVKKRGKEKMSSGELMEDWSYFLINKQKDNIQIDYGYYLEHNIMKPVTEVLNIAFPAPEKQFYKPEDNFKRAMEIYLKPKWVTALKAKSLEYKSKYIAKYSKRKALREAARSFYARLLLDKMYKQHGLKIRRYHRPKIGQSVIYLNDKILLQVFTYHRDWNEVLWQILDRRNIPEWIEEMWSH